MKLNIAFLLAMLVFAIEPEPNFDGIATTGAGNRPVLRIAAVPRLLMER